MTTNTTQAAPTLNLDGVEYRIDQLSEAARIQLINVQATDAELARLQQKFNIMQTARATYVQALKNAVTAA